MSAWEVGQPVIVRHRNYGRGPARVSRAVVTRVGRKYVYVTPEGTGSEMTFEASGLERGDSNYRSQVFTPEQFEAEEANAAAATRLWEHTRDTGWRNRLTVEQMNAISDVIERGES